MGKIKSKPIRRTVNILLKKDFKFSEDFTRNKKLLEHTLSSKKVRNQTAGLLVRKKRQEKESQDKLLVSA